MTQRSDQYQRKISTEEAKNAYLLVLKSKLSFFPQAPKSFQLRVGKTKLNAKVESYPCTCRGPELPHQHYFIRCKDLKAGDTARIVKRNDGEYVLSFVS